MFKRVHALRLCVLCSEENRIFINILIYLKGAPYKLTPPEYPIHHDALGESTESMRAEVCAKKRATAR